MESSNKGGLAEKTHLGLASVRPLEWSSSCGLTKRANFFSRSTKIEPRSHSLALGKCKTSQRQSKQRGQLWRAVSQACVARLPQTQLQQTATVHGCDLVTSKMRFFWRPSPHRGCAPVGQKLSSNRKTTLVRVVSQACVARLPQTQLQQTATAHGCELVTSKMRFFWRPSPRRGCAPVGQKLSSNGRISRMV